MLFYLFKKTDLATKSIVDYGTPNSTTLRGSENLRIMFFRIDFKYK